MQVVHRGVVEAGRVEAETVAGEVMGGRRWSIAGVLAVTAAGALLPPIVAVLALLRLLP